MTTRMEIVGRVSGRRHWTVEQKLAILRDAFGPDGSVRAAIERHASRFPLYAGTMADFFCCESQGEIGNEAEIYLLTDNPSRLTMCPDGF